MKNFVVYKSSAGSGKTYTLVREYISLALMNPSYFRQILAITFTNKAANEMKQRVLTSLLHLSDPVKFKNTPAVRFMQKEIAESAAFPVEQISPKAKEVLATILHDYDDFAVRTIDSFVSRIIRTFAHDLHLPVDFEIEMDKDALLDEAVTRLISKAGVDPELTKILVEYTESKAADEKSWHIEKDIHHAGNHLFSEQGNKFASSLRHVSAGTVLKIISRVKAVRSAFIGSIQSTAASALQLITEREIPLDAFYFGKQGIGSYFNSLAQGDVKLPNSRVLDTIAKNSWTGGKTEPSVHKAIMDIVPDLNRCYSLIFEQLEHGFESFCLLELAAKNLYQLGVIGAVEQEISEIKKENGILHISEFNKLITDIIVKEPVPFIYERTGERYRHYLVDEFQDTSELQWKNLLPLITNSLASGSFNLVVGDGKQAIYRFRNGQVEQFMLLPDLPAGYEEEVFNEAKLALRNNFRENLLNSNFRSLPGIIEFNNDFFTWIAGRLDSSLRNIYNHHEQKAVQGKEGGFVSIDFIRGDDRADFSRRTLEQVLLIINDLHLKGYAYSDIVILTRSNAQGSLTARFLIDKELNVVSNEALLLASSAEVNLLVSALSVLADPDDQIAKAAILVYLSLRKKLQSDLNHLSISSSPESFHAFLEDAGFPLNRARLLAFPVYDICEELIRIFRLNESGYDPFIQFFLEFVNRMTLRETYDLKDLLNEWDEKKDKLSVIVPEGIDAIRIMTIHKAKGLEFPVVIWPFATDSMKNTNDSVWVSPVHPALEGLPSILLPLTAELEKAGHAELYTLERNKSLLDLINLIYVAFTRPAERLYILSKFREGSSTGLPGMLSEYLGQTELPWFDEGDTYTYGEELITMPGKQNEEKDSPYVSSFLSQNWHGKINIAKRAPDIWEGVDTGSQQQWGQWVHDTLAEIARTGDQGNAIRRTCKSGMFDEVQSERLVAQVSAVLNHHLLKPVFSSGVTRLSENGILLPDGAIIRPDLVALTDNGAVLVEFKTGKPSEDHIKQVYKYADALLAIGYVVYKKYLVYIDDSQVDVKEVE